MGGFADLAAKLRDKSTQPAPALEPEAVTRSAKLDRMDDARERYERLCMQRAVFIRQSSLKRAEINHSLNRGDPADKTLLLALECIAAMTGDAMAVKIYADRHRGHQDAQQPVNDDNTH